jgi:hypothetical protein
VGVLSLSKEASLEMEDAPLEMAISVDRYFAHAKLAFQ